MRRTARLFASIMVLALLIAACGGDEGGEPDGTSAGGGESPEGATGADCALDQVDGDLNFYNWSEYMDPDLVTAFEEQYQVDVVEDFYESNEALLAQMQAGAVYDLIVPSDYMVGIMIENGLLAPLNTAAVPNLRHLEWFHDHVRVDGLLFTGVLDPAGGVVHPGADGTPGHGLALRAEAAEPYRES